jgi:DNA-binding NarL/FixJ family response regulator
MNVSLSSVAELAASALQTMGVVGSVRTTPFILVAAVHAFRRHSYPAASVYEVAIGGQPTVRVVAVVRAERCLRETLTGSEYEITRLRSEGHNHVAIAAARQTSARTVANQIGSTYRKLKVNSRIELMCSAIEQECAVAGESYPLGR